MRLPEFRSDVIRRFGLWVVLAAVTAVLALVSPTFRQPINLQNVLEQNAIIGIVACGMAIMMIAGGFDLSVGATGVSASVLAAVLAIHSGTAAAVAGALLLGVLIGVVNGVLIATARINPFVATFAMASIVSGLLFVATGANPTVAQVQLLADAAGKRVQGVPVAFLIFLACLAVVWLFLTRTRYGHYVYSVGGNEEASHLSGVPVQRVKVLAFALGGLFAAAGGLLLLGQTAVGQPSAGGDWPLRAIAICVVGGITLTGGVGRVQNVLAATLFLGVIANSLNQLGVSIYWQPAVTGVVILLAVVLERYNHRQRPRTGRDPVRPEPLAGPVQHPASAAEPAH